MNRMLRTFTLSMLGLMVAPGDTGAGRPLGVEYLGVVLGAPMASVRVKHPKVTREELKQNGELFSACDRKRKILFRFFGEPYTKGWVKSISARRDDKGLCKVARIARLDLDPTSAIGIGFASVETEIVRVLGPPTAVRTTGDEHTLVYQLPDRPTLVKTSWQFTIKGDRVAAIKLVGWSPEAASLLEPPG